jgi:hypothetical protein
VSYSVLFQDANHNVVQSTDAASELDAQVLKLYSLYVRLGSTAFGVAALAAAGRFDALSLSVTTADMLAGFGDESE